MLFQLFSHLVGLLQILLFCSVVEVTSPSSLSSPENPQSVDNVVTPSPSTDDSPVPADHLPAKANFQENVLFFLLI